MRTTKSIRFPFLAPSILLTLLCFVAIEKVQAIYTEVGLSYSYKKTSFDANNFTESEMTTTSMSFYLWEKIALETSYSKGTAVHKEKASTYPARTITQFTDVAGADVIFAFADRKAPFQPFIKGGLAKVIKKLTVQDEGDQAFPINPTPGVVPSYGLGLKILFSDSMSFSLGADVWRTPLDDGTTTNDVAGRAGINFIF